MQYLINDTRFSEEYSRTEVQQLIHEKKIGVNTEIWTESWGEWKPLRQTDFDLQGAILDQTENAVFEMEPSIGWQVFSFLMPLLMGFIGLAVVLIMYAIKRNESVKVANLYLKLASLGWLVGRILKLLLFR